MGTRWILVDDISPLITYDRAGWFSDLGSQDSAGNFGPPYKSMLHGTQQNGTLSFTFSGGSRWRSDCVIVERLFNIYAGTGVQVFGANNLRNDSGVLDPQWECFIDNISIGATTPFQYPGNHHWVFRIIPSYTPPSIPSSILCVRDASHDIKNLPCAVDRSSSSVPRDVKQRTLNPSAWFSGAPVGKPAVLARGP